LALWKINNEEDAVLIPKIEVRIFPVDFGMWNFLGQESHYAATPLIVAVCPGRSNITRFCPRSPIATGNHLDHAKKIPKVAQTTGTIDFLIRIQAFRDPLCGELLQSKSS